MKTNTIPKRILSVLLVCTMLLPGLLLHSSAAQTFSSKKTAVQNGDGTYRITFEAFQTGKVEPTDVVMVLDVSGSMEYNTPVEVSAVDPAKDYYIRYVYLITDGTYVWARQENIKVHNTAPAGEEPTWYGDFSAVPGMGVIRVYPAGEDNYTATLNEERSAIISMGESEFVFYTGAMEKLRASAASFVESIAENAELYGADHRVAVVEFSSPTEKNDASLCTHDNPYYANILSGSGAPDGAFVSAKTQKDALLDTFAGLTAGGPTYSDDAMAQAEAILNADSSEDRSRMVVLFTDGGPGSYGWLHDTDASALPTANAAIASAGRMKADGVTIYTIGVFNDDDLHGDIGEKNATYLNAVSSNYPDAADLENIGVKASEAYCTVGSLDMDLSDVFSDISEVIGVPIDSAYVSDTVSEYFYMTDAQKQALLAVYPGATITENANNTTTVELRDINFPPVGTDVDGNPVDPDDVFKMSFDVTPREELLGGRTFSTNTGACGVFTADGAQIAQFDVPAVEVPVSEKVLGDLIAVKTPTFYKGQSFLATDLYTPQTAEGADKITYTVFDDSGEKFTEGKADVSRTFTVKADVEIDGKTYSYEKPVTFSVIPDEPASITVTKLPTKTNYLLGESVLTDGMTVQAAMKSGNTVTVENSALTVSPKTLTKTGTQTVTVTYAGKTATFPVTVEAPVTAEELDSLLSVKTPTFYAGQTILPQDLYTAKTMADVDSIQYVVKDAGGAAVPAAGVKAEQSGTFTLTVTVKRGTRTYTADKTISYTVVPDEIGSIAVKSQPVKRSYFVGDSVDLTGIAVTLVMKSGNRQELDASELTVTPAVLTKAGTQNLTLSYKNLSLTVPVTVEAVKPVRAEVVKKPAQPTYVYRKAPVFTGLSVKVIYNNGTEETVNDLSEMQIRVASTAKVRRGAQKYNVTVDGVTAAFDMQVKLVWWQWLILILLFGWIWY